MHFRGIYPKITGRDAGIWTPGPLNPIQVRFQTAPRPEICDFDLISFRPIVKVKNDEMTSLLTHELE